MSLTIDLAGKRALVTGVTSGIGVAIATWSVRSWIVAERSSTFYRPLPVPGRF